MVKTKDRWSSLSMSEKDALFKIYVSNGITSLDDIKKDYNSFEPGGPIEIDEYGYPADITPAIVTQDAEFNKFLMTLPDNLRLTPEKDYYLYKSWKMNGRPRNFQEGLEANMYNWDDSDNSYHGVTVIGYDENGVGIFGKPKHHDTVHYELDWYNKGIGTLEGGKQYPLQGEERKEWEDFRSQYQLDSTGVNYKYVPRKHHNSFGDGGNLSDKELNDGTYKNRVHTSRIDTSIKHTAKTIGDGMKLSLGGYLSLLKQQSLQESRVNKFVDGGNTDTDDNDKSTYRSSVRDSLMYEEPKTQRDNTRAYQASDNAFVSGDIPMRDDVLLSEGITGLLPFVGDALQVVDAVNDIYNQNYGRAALTAGLMLVPNIIEKPVKAVAKPLKRFITHGIDSDSFRISMRNWKGSPMPSMAVNDVDLPMFDYGDMTFIGSSDLLDNSIIFKGDGMTPTVSTVGGDYVDDVQEVVRRMKAQQNTDEFNIGEVISKEDASTLPISGEGIEKYFEAKYQDFMSWNQFKHLVTYGELDADLLKIIEELKIPHTNVSAEDYIDTIKRIAAEEGLLFKKGGKINTFNDGGNTETSLQTPQINKKNLFNFLNINQKNPVQKFQAAVDESKYNYSYDGMSEDLKNAWMQADEDYRSFSESIIDLESYGSNNEDTSEIVTITAPNTDISKFVFNNKISKNALLEIQRVAELRNQDPYDILAHMLIEASGSIIDTSRYFNTHNVIRSQINPAVLNYFGKDRLKQIKQFGIYKDGKTDYSAEEILKAASRMNDRRNSALESVVVPESYIDAIALYMLLSGRDFNPAQKGYTDSGGTVKHSYLEMIDSAIQSLKSGMPNLFENL